MFFSIIAVRLYVAYDFPKYFIWTWDLVGLTHHLYHHKPTAYLLGPTEMLSTMGKTFGIYSCIIVSPGDKTCQTVVTGFLEPDQDVR